VTTEEKKRAAAEAAAELVADGMSIGLGSGSTAHEFMRALGRRVASGLSIRAVASSTSTADLAKQCGIPLIQLNGPLDLAVDGADAVASTTLDAVKGLGGALMRERIVVEQAACFVLIVDDAKVVEDLGQALTQIPVPVAVVPFGWQTTRERLSRFGDPKLRTTSDGAPYATDDGNFILDLHAPHLPPDLLAAQLKALTGVVDHGLFLGLASLALVGADGGVLELRRAGDSSC
jgi:ribose 5-phosphate isomerase A